MLASPPLRALPELFDSVCGAPWGEPLKYMPRTPRTPALPTPAPPADQSQIDGAGSLRELTTRGPGVKRGVVEMQADAEGDTNMEQRTLHGGTSALPAPLTPMVTLGSSFGQALTPG